jgi:hypothetical protein
MAMDNTNEGTSNFLNWVEIKNFKSIKDLRLDCKRVNIFIGKPNVGKSNILEGLGMLGAGFTGRKAFDGYVRYRNLKQLFFNNDWREPIQIIIDKQIIDLETNQAGTSGDFLYSVTTKSDGGSLAQAMNDFAPRLANRYELSTDGLILNTGSVISDQLSPYRKYDFANLDTFTNSFQEFLIPPNGPNLFEVIDQSTDLKNEFGTLFQQQGLDFVLSRDDQSIELQRKSGFYVLKYPFFSIADTFRRFMFYIAAIESNKNSVIVFEEPEVHSFPPYTQELAYRMIYDESNQYFISTHSPYMLHPFIEKMDYQDLNVFITYYKDYQTHVRALTEEELTDILDFSTNVFFNLNKFEPNA